jgi:hypothetical protein
MTATTLKETTYEEIDVGATRGYKRASTTDFHTTGAEAILLGPIHVKGLAVMNYFYRNKSAANAHTLKVYHSPSETMPTTMEDGSWKQIYTESVSAASKANPIVFKNDYEWLMVTCNGTAEADVGDCTFIGSHRQA